MQQRIGPDVGFRPVRKRKDPRGLPLAQPGVEQPPELRTLLARLPGVAGAAHGNDPLLGARLFLVTACAAEDDVISPLIQGGLQRLGPHHQGVAIPVVERVHAGRPPGFVRMGDELEAVLRRKRIPELDEGLELPGRVDMQQGKRGLRRVERPQREMRHDGGVLARREQHDRVLRLGDGFPDDVDGLRLQPGQVRAAGPQTRHVRSPADQIGDAHSAISGEVSASAPSATSTHSRSPA